MRGIVANLSERLPDATIVAWRKGQARSSPGDRHEGDPIDDRVLQGPCVNLETGGGPLQGAIDTLDEKIILALFQDVRASYKSIATAVGVSHNTVRARMARLLNEKIIRLVVVTDPPKVGLWVTAFIRISVEADHIEPVGRALASRKEVTSVYHTLGDSDILCLAHFEHNAQLFKFVSHYVGQLEGVTDVHTTIACETIKGLPDRQVPFASIEATEGVGDEVSVAG